MLVSTSSSQFTRQVWPIKIRVKQHDFYCTGVPSAALNERPIWNLELYHVTQCHRCCTFLGSVPVGVLTVGISTRAFADELNFHFTTVGCLKCWLREFGGASNQPWPCVTTTPARHLHIWLHKVTKWIWMWEVSPVPTIWSFALSEAAWFWKNVQFHLFGQILQLWFDWSIRFFFHFHWKKVLKNYYGVIFAEICPKWRCFV